MVVGSDYLILHTALRINYLKYTKSAIIIDVMHTYGAAACLALRTGDGKSNRAQHEASRRLYPRKELAAQTSARDQ